MRRLVAVVGLVALAAGSFGAPAGAAKRKAKPRVIEFPYTAPAYGTAGFGLCFQGESCLFYGPPAAKERSFSVEIEDELGREVYASVIQDTNGDGSYLRNDDLTVDFCGKTEKPVEIEPNKDVSVWVWQGPGVTSPCAGTASSGTVTGTFSAT
ncbi:MAG: hypothetical protein H0U53_08175 [Actinobacteria bacterium]|nr:hypothetical protein [Actinomycetota bacterium]